MFGSVRLANKNFTRITLYQTEQIKINLPSVMPQKKDAHWALKHCKCLQTPQDKGSNEVLFFCM